LLLPTWYTDFLFVHINYIKLNSSTCFERVKFFLDICLAVHHSITFLLLPTLYTNFLFIHTNYINPLNAELNPICYLLALLGAHHFLHVSSIRVKLNSSTCSERNPLIIRRSTTQIVHMQPLVSSLSASDCLVQPLRQVYIVFTLLCVTGWIFVHLFDSEHFYSPRYGYDC